METYYHEKFSNSLIFSVDSRDALIKEIIDELFKFNTSMMVGDINIEHFSDGEVCSDYLTSVRGKRVYLLSSPNTAEKVLQLNFAIDAAKRAGAKEIIPIIPYFPYARQELRPVALMICLHRT